MQNPLMNVYTECVDLYRNGVELNLRAAKILQNATERSLREHLAFVEATVGQLTPIAKADQPTDIVAAQSTLFQGVRDQMTETAKNLLKIQQDTGVEIKALITEGMESFSPEAVSKRFAKAA